MFRLTSSPLAGLSAAVALSTLTGGGTLLAAVPSWWSQGSPPPLSAAEANNKGVANVGQGKWMARSALENLRATLGPGSSVVAAIESDLYKATETSTDGVFFPERPADPSAEWLQAQKAPLQIGALKALAAPFYKHLTQYDPAWVEGQIQENGLATKGTDYFEDADGTLYPWNPADNQAPEKNRAAANIGQLKLVFSLRLEALDAGIDTDIDGDGLPDAWEIEHFGDLTTADPDGKLFPDGLTNKEKSELGLGPLGDDLTVATERITYTYDGERLENVDFYTQREFGYGLDGNGNIESTTSD